MTSRVAACRLLRHAGMPNMERVLKARIAPASS
jgi:hypothetical protein